MKWWIDSEEGKLALEELQDIPAVMQVLTEHSHRYLKAKEQELLHINMLQAEKDREMLVRMSELKGARDLVKSFIELLSKQTPAKREPNATRQSR